MTSAGVELSNDEFHVPAELIAPLLKLEAVDISNLMKSNEITSACERGEGADSGTHRLTFWHDSRRARIVIDDKGTILRTSTVSLGDNSPALRRLVR